MPYVQVTDFKLGLDRRKNRVSGVPGSLWGLKNAQITRGGDIERPKKFVPVYPGLSNTFGMETVGSQLFVFGSADLAASMPVGVRYQRLQSPSSAAMVRILWSNGFDGKIYAIAEYADGDIHHFYDGTRNSEWDAVAAANSSFTTLADYLARKVGANAAVDAINFGGVILLTATTPGAGFTVSATATNGGSANDQTATVATVQANVAAAGDIRASGTITITGGTSDPGVNTVSQVTVNAVPLLANPVDWRSSHTATATAVVVAINNRTSMTGISASALGAVITLRAAPGLGSTANGRVIVATKTGNVTSTTSGSLAGGVSAVSAVAQVSTITLGGTYEATDKFSITVNGTAYPATGSASAHGTSAFVYKKREYFTVNSLYYYSKLNDPSDITDAGVDAGAGFINMSNDSEGAERLVASVGYQGFVAIFARKSIRIYDLQSVASLNNFQQAVENTGTLAPRSVISYGNTDTFYLDDTGIRSLQVRDIANAPFVNDVGSAIDTIVQQWYDEAGEEEAERAVSTIEPVDGRFMLAIGNRIFILSYFPSSKITAWSYLEPGFTVTDFVQINRKLYARDAGTIYLYGGRRGDTYPEAGELVAEVELPFLSANSPATFKQWEGFDIICSGVWDTDLLIDPNDTSKVIDVGKFTKTTFAHPAIKVVGDTPLVALKLTCSSAGNATISGLTLHYDANEAS